MQAPLITYLDVTLTPNRSLSPRGLVILCTIIGVLSFIGGVVFYSMGAIAVMGFFGLDALALFFALRAVLKKSSQETRVIVTADTLRVDHRTAEGAERSAELPSAFTRVDLYEEAGLVRGVELKNRGEAWVIGRFMGPDDCRSLVERLQDALSDARRERFPGAVAPE